MSRNIGQVPQPSTVVNQVPIGGVAQVLRSGDAYKAVGEVVSRAAYPALSAAFPRNGSLSIVTNPLINMDSCAFGNGVFVCVATGSSTAFVSNDASGKTFAPYAMPPISGTPSICFGNGIFVVVCSGASGVGSTSIYTSADGKTWATQSAPSTSYWTSVVYGGGIFVAVSGTAANPSTAAMSSTDGLTWAARTLPSSAGWADVAYGAGTFVAVGSGGACATSAAGTSWAAKVIGLGSVNYSGIDFGSSNGVSNFVAVNGTSNQVAYSSSGTGAWSVSILPGTSNIVTYGNGVFIASQAAGFAFSVDAGVTWRYASSSGVTSIGYGAGTFLGVTRSGGGASLNLYAENLVDSDYQYLSGTAGQYVRVK